MQTSPLLWGKSLQTEANGMYSVVDKKDAIKWVLESIPFSRLGRL